jgi:hypothetical protein
MLFQWMARLRTYQAGEDAELTELLKTKVSGMKDEDWRALAIKWLSQSGIKLEADGQ